MTRRQVFKAAVAGGLVLSGGVAFSQFGNREDLRVERHELRLPRWDADGFRVALLTDLHMDSPRRLALAGRALRVAVEQKPDVVLIGGDFLSTEDWRVHELAFRVVEGSLGDIPTYGVPGNHEYWLDSASSALYGLSRSHSGPRSRLLRNETVDVGGVTVMGLDDGLVDRDRHDLLSAKHDKDVLCLFHEPDFVTRIDQRCSLMLAGHTHGGQVCLPFGFPLVTPFGGRKYVRGFYPNAPVPLFVSRGVGAVGIDRRAFCPPEVAILTLRLL